jgi:hypothetical protein
VTSRPATGAEFVALKATAGMVMGWVFLVFGLGLGAVVWSETPGGEDGLRLALGLFMAVWVAGCTTIVILMARLRSLARSRAARAPDEREKTWGP